MFLLMLLTLRLGAVREIVDKSFVHVLILHRRVKPLKTYILVAWSAVNHKVIDELSKSSPILFRH